MRSRNPRTPKYRLHRPSGLAVVTLNGKDHYLGAHGTAESRAEYDRLVAEWLAGGRRLVRSAVQYAGSDLTVSELLVAYIRHVEAYYRRPDGTPTSEPGNIRLALRPLKELYGRTPAAAFGPLALKAVRQRMIEPAPATGAKPGRGLCRNEINKRVRHIVRCFRWAVQEELVPPTVPAALQAVPGLRKGRTTARESAPVRPAPEEAVQAVLPLVLPPVRAMIELQQLTGMRPGEVCAMRTGDIDMSGAVWLYRPAVHKMSYRGHEREVPIGPRAQDILKPWLKAVPEAYLFSPHEAVAAWRAEQRRNRKTRVQPSQVSRKRKRPQREAAEQYRVDGYAHAIARACKRAGVEHWHPHQLRHSAATRLRREFGLDTARTVLGHRSANVTEDYAEQDREKARQAMAASG